ICYSCFFFQAEDGIRDFHVTGVQTCALPISKPFRKCLGKTPVGVKAQPVLVSSMPPSGVLPGRPQRAVRRVIACGWLRPKQENQIGRASCRERVEISGGAGSVEEKEEDVEEE